MEKSKNLSEKELTGKTRRWGKHDYYIPEKKEIDPETKKALEDIKNYQKNYNTHPHTIEEEKQHIQMKEVGGKIDEALESFANAVHQNDVEKKKLRQKQKNK